MPATPAPDKGTPMGVPVRRGGLNSLAHLLPRFKAAAFERQRPQYFPPRLDQVEVGRIDRTRGRISAESYGFTVEEIGRHVPQ